jgi:hypothetical protein|nr:MAG TPA: hypothetical protein [Caudoviricetes sp.]
MAKGNKAAPKDKAAIAQAEYDRLVKLFTDAGVDKIKLDIYGELIRKVAEVFSCLEVIKDLPTILYDPKNPTVQKETAAGKVRVKYMAQYTSAMQKLNKDLLDALNDDDSDELQEYDDDNDGDDD